MPDPYFKRVTNRLVEEAVKAGAKREEIDKLLEKESNPDFRMEWMKLNAPRVKDEPGILLNHLAARTYGDENGKKKISRRRRDVFKNIIINEEARLTTNHHPFLTFLLSFVGPSYPFPPPPFLPTTTCCSLARQLDD